MLAAVYVQVYDPGFYDSPDAMADNLAVTFADRFSQATEMEGRQGFEELERGPVCLPLAGITDAVRIDVLLPDDLGLNVLVGRYIVFVHEGRNYYVYGISPDEDWPKQEKYIDTVLYSFRFEK